MREGVIIAMIKITSDSVCDLSPALLSDFGVTLVPLTITVGDASFRDGIDITPADLFRYVGEGKSCKTAAVNVFDYTSLFGEFSSDCEAVIHICLGSAFSSCFQNASIAARDFQNVYVVDSQNLSSGTGHVVYEAARLAREGLPASEIVARLEELVPRVDASFVIDRLDYLHKGGRCSGVEALGARIFRIKPCIEVTNGIMAVGKKYLGSFDAALERYVSDRLRNPEDIDPSLVFITHPMCPPETVARVREAVERAGLFERIIETKAGCTVSGHCGPNTLGILFRRFRNKTARPV